MTVEGVERQPGEHRVADRVLLSELVPRLHFGARLVPCAPLVDDELHLALRVVLGERLPVARDERLHPIAVAEQVVPFLDREGQRVALAGVPVGRTALAHVPGVVVDGPAPHAIDQVLVLGRERGEEAARPLDLAAVRAGADEGERHAIAGHPRREAPELGRVLLRREVAAAAP